MTVQTLIPILQIAIGPVVLISGVGLLILSMTNRLGRVIDRGRSLVRELPEIPERNHARVTSQLHILSRRANLLQQAIIFAVFCVLFAAVLIITLFFTADETGALLVHGRHEGVGIQGRQADSIHLADDALVEGNRFVGNTAGTGAGVYFSAFRAGRIQNNLFLANRAYDPTAFGGMGAPQVRRGTCRRRCWNSPG